MFQAPSVPPSKVKELRERFERGLREFVRVCESLREFKRV